MVENIKNKTKTFAFDIGTASIGWAVVEAPNEDTTKFDENTGEVFNNINIVASGVRMFNEPVVPDNKTKLLNLARRENRLSRKRTKRKANRKKEVKELLLSLGYYNKEDFEHFLENGEINYNTVFQRIIFDNKKDPSKYNIFYLRVKALDHQLTKDELAVILFNLVKTRGFKSSKKTRKDQNELEIDDKENGAVLKSIKELKEKQEEYKKRTFVELIYHLNSTGEKKSYRNKEGSYSNSILRTDIINEAKQILYKQREFYKELTNDFEEKLLKIIEFQNEIKFDRDSVGMCTYLKEEHRASKSCFSVEYFTSIGRLINLRIKKANQKEEISLTKEEVLTVLSKTQDNFGDLTYKKLRKYLNLAKEYYFKGLPYSSETNKSKNYHEDPIEDDKKKLLVSFKETNKVDKYLKPLVENNELSKDNYNTILSNPYVLDQLVQLNSLYNQTEIVEEINKDKNLQNLNQEIKNAIIYCNLNFTKYINLSLKAINLMLPYMKEVYKKVEVMGIETNVEDDKNRWNSTNVIQKLKEDKIFIDPEIKKNKKLPSILEIENQGYIYIPKHAVIKRAIAQFIKTYNAMVNEYKEPDVINIELLRELKSPSKRGKYTKEREKNTKEIELAIKECLEYNLLDSKTNITKIRLWKEQSHICPYCQNQISPECLNNDGELQIDHIIPESLSFDNSYTNKVLVCSACNQNKKQQTPYLWLKDDHQKWEKFKNWVNNSNISDVKRGKLLTEKSLLEITQGFVERQRNDSAYITTLIKDIIEKYVDFDSKNKKRHVYATKGGLTSILRESLGFKKYREDKDLHADKGYFLYNNIVWNKEKNPQIVEELKELQKNINIATSSKDNKLHSSLSKEFKLIKDGFIDYLSNYFSDVIKEPSKEIKKYINDDFNSYLAELKVNKTFDEDLNEMEKLFIGDKHHALDAILIGLSNASVIKQIGALANQADEAILNKAKNFPRDSIEAKKLWKLHYKGNLHNKIQFLLKETSFISDKLKIDNLPLFKNQISESLDKIFVSRQPNRKINGRIHEDTIYSAKETKKYADSKGNLKLTKRKNVLSLTDAEIDKIVGDGSEIVKKAIIDWKKNKEEGTTEEYPTMPTKSGLKGPFIKKVTLITSETGDSFSSVRGGIANFDGTIRVDVFKVAKKDKTGNFIKDNDGNFDYQYVFRTITLADLTLEKRISNKLRYSQGKNYNLNSYKNDECIFCFSMSKKDLIAYKLSKEDKEYKFMYFDSISNANIVLSDHLGVSKLNKTITTFYYLQKAQVDPLGKISIVKNNIYEDFSSLINKFNNKKK